MTSERMESAPPPAEIVVRVLGERDLDDLVRIDAAVSGRARPEYYRVKLAAALRDGVQISLAAELDGKMIGFLIGSVYYGDFGQPEPVATLDAIGVDPAASRRGVATALWRQLATNLKGMRISRVQTQVDWTDWELLSFLRQVGFAPAPRICIERQLQFEADD